jgi:L-ribulose-5-phosphate 4-epimerase
MSWNEQREELVATCRRAVAMGLQMSTGGNLTLRLPGGSFLVKPSGIALYDLAERDLLVTDAAGTVLEGAGKPTKELPSHLAIYAVAPRVGAIVHYHAPFATAFAVAGKTVPLLTVHARRTLGSIPVVPPAPEGSRELGLSLAQVFERGEAKAALLAGHGLLAVGGGLPEAQAIAELVEESAKVARLAAGL